MPGYMLYALVWGLSGGIALSSLWGGGAAAALFFVLLAGAVIACRHIVHGSEQSRPLVIVSLVFLSVSLGILRMEATRRGEQGNFFNQQVGRMVHYAGVISEEPDRRVASVRLIVDITATDEAGGEIHPRQRILVTTDPYPVFAYGDEVGLSGRLSRPKSFTTDSGRIFDYPSYLKKDGISYEMFKPEISRRSSGNGNLIKENLLSLKSAFIERAGELIPEPNASLLFGLVVGLKHSLPDELLQNFRTVSLIHIVVLSGYNITIIAEFFMKLFSFLRLKTRLFFGAVSIVLFSIMVGAGATVVRAAIMALLILLTRGAYRRYDVSRALALAATVMLMHNPRILVFDPSFQLSFLATLGLLYASPIIEKYFHFFTEKFNLREIAVATVATQIFVLPLLIFMTGKVSIVGFIANLFVLPIIPFTMFFGFCTGAVAFVSTTLATPFALVSSALLSYIVFAAEQFSRLPLASVGISFVSPWITAALYAVILWWVWRANRSLDRPTVA